MRSRQKTFVGIARSLGHTTAEGRRAYLSAVKSQEALHVELKRIGRLQITEIEQNPQEIGIVLFGRSYNAFSELVNKGIPHKFASRGYRIIPCDFLDFEPEEDPEHVYWGIGEINLKAAKIVRRHPSLFGVYITNFSCGPDSFLVDFFRKEMGGKPSLTLELDNHTADVGLDTRIEAFIDVVHSHIKLNEIQPSRYYNHYRPAKISTRGNRIRVIDSQGDSYKLTNPHVHVLFPSMMDRASKALSSALRYHGIRADAVPDPTEEEFKLGQGHTSGKECLPAIVTTGSLLKYVRDRASDDELLVYLMPGDSGPCRFGSYYLLMQNMVEKLRIPNVAFLSFSQDEGYAGLNAQTRLRVWQAILTTDILENVYSAILVLAADKEYGLLVFEEISDDIIRSFARDKTPQVETTLRRSVEKLQCIQRKSSLEEAPKVALAGEMYVRRNNFSRNYIVEKLADRNLITLVGALHEWIYYIDYVVRNGYVQSSTPRNRVQELLERLPKRYYEKKIKSIFAESGFYQSKIVDMDRVIDSASDLITPSLVCESILIAGTAITEMIEEVAGIIAIQPFGCMPGRIAEAVLDRNLSHKKKERAIDRYLVEQVMEWFPRLPFLTLEVDGQVSTQGTEAKLEAFVLQVQRMHAKTQGIALSRS